MFRHPLSGPVLKAGGRLEPLAPTFALNTPLHNLVSSQCCCGFYRHIPLPSLLPSSRVASPRALILTHLILEMELGSRPTHGKDPRVTDVIVPVLCKTLQILPLYLK